MELRSNYNKYRNFITPYALSKYARQVFKDIGVWYKNNQDTEGIDWDGFSEWFRVIQHPTYEEDETALYFKLFEKLSGVDTEDVIYDQIIQGFIERDYATKMVEFLMEVVEGRQPAKSFSKINQMLTAYDASLDKISEQEDAYISDSVEELLADVVGEGGLDWRLPELNISAGPLRVGNNVMIAAYTNVGKTTLALSETTHMIPQFKEGEELVYLCNEEQGKQNKLRCIQALTGSTSNETINNPALVAKRYNEYKEKNGEVFHFYWKPTMTTRFVEETLKLHNPGLIIIDQLWNIEGFSDAGTSTEMYTALARWVRRIAEIAPCISLHQADGSSFGVKHVEANQLYGSKVGMQGAMDGIITVGQAIGGGVNDLERGLFVAKHKLPGGPPPFDPKQKSQRWTVYIDPELALFKSGM